MYHMHETEILLTADRTSPPFVLKCLQGVQSKNSKHPLLFVPAQAESWVEDLQDDLTRAWALAPEGGNSQCPPSVRHRKQDSNTAIAVVCLRDMAELLPTMLQQVCMHCNSCLSAMQQKASKSKQRLHLMGGLRACFPQGVDGFAARAETR